MSLSSYKARTNQTLNLIQSIKSYPVSKWVNHKLHHWILKPIHFLVAGHWSQNIFVVEKLHNKHSDTLTWHVKIIKELLKEVQQSYKIEISGSLSLSLTNNKDLVNEEFMSTKSLCSAVSGSNWSQRQKN